MNFSLARIYAILLKEFLQMRRDRITLGMIIGVPLMQLFLFGFAINFNPKALPTAVGDLKRSGLWRTLRHPDPQAIGSTLVGNWELQDGIGVGASLGHAAYNNRGQGYRQSIEHATFSVILGPLGPAAQAALQAEEDAVHAQGAPAHAR